MNEEILNRFREHGRRREIDYIHRLGSTWILLPLYLLFWIADLVYAPALKWKFLALRALVIPLTAISHFYLGKFHRNRAKTEVVLSFFYLGNSAILTTMIFMTEGARSPYYAGINLLAVGALALPPWSNKFLALNVGLIYGPFLILGWLLPRSPVDTSIFVVNGFFICGTVATVLGVRAIMERLREKELKSRVLLHKELKSRAEIIERKTAEGLRLRSLASQFSPQVVHTIQNGGLNLVDSVKYSPICAIFIDIVNSTDQIKKISIPDIQRVIRMFMQDTIRTLLKHDITIDKFLGDGVLGFSNAPIPRSDYIERAVDAALEVKHRINARSADYWEHWYAQLRIRIGVASGDASVGFYGSEEYFKTYTAIGKVVNLASRLCNAAAPNQIVVSEDVQRKLPSALYELNPITGQTLKGFEEDHLNLFEVVSSHRLDRVVPDVSLCPNGHGVLHLDTNPEGFFIFACRNCGYVKQDPLEGPASPVRKSA